MFSELSTSALSWKMGRAHNDGPLVRQLSNEPPLGRIREEVTSNYQVFLRLREGLTGYEGNYALMRSGMIIAYFPSRNSAVLAGHERFLDRVFSIHRLRATLTGRP